MSKHFADMDGMYQSATPTIVCQISRGVAPSICIVEAVQAAQRHGAQYRLIAGLSAVDAKEEAVTVALATQSDLVLCEDDMLATDDQWRRAITGSDDRVLVASAPCRNGVVNTIHDTAGRVLWSGTVLVRIPYPILECIAAQGRPTFQCWDCHPDFDASELHPVCPNNRGEASDVYLYYRLTQMDPRPEVEELGMVVALQHPFNTGAKRLNAPIELVPVQVTA